METIDGAHAVSFVVTEPSDLARARERACREALAAGVAPDRIIDVAMALTEAASNVLVHTRAPAAVRCFTTSEGFVCEVTDTGTPPTEKAWLKGALGPTAGLGLSVIRGASDHVDILPHGPGTKVRMLFDRV